MMSSSRIWEAGSPWGMSARVYALALTHSICCLEIEDSMVDVG